MAIPGKRDPRNDAPVDDEQDDVQGHGMDMDGLDDPGLDESPRPGRVRAIDPRTNQQ